MADKGGGGSSPSATKDLLWVVGIFVALGFVWLFTGGPSRQISREGPFIEPPAPLGSGRTSGLDGASGNDYSGESIGSYSGGASPQDATHSPWYGQVQIDTGSASSEYQASQEYIVLRADYDLNAPLDVTGWQLANGASRRGYRTSAAVLPRAVKLFVAGAKSQPTVPIILAPGGEVVVVTGGPPSAKGTVFSSFQVNQCVEYLEGAQREHNRQSFAPSLSASCLDEPEKVVDVYKLDRKCYDFVQGLASCHSPVFEQGKGDDDNDYVDGQVDDLTRQCRLMIQSTFTYNACVARHAGDADFYTNEWRAFLNHSGELWAKDRETISLYDAQGRLVASTSY